MAKLQPVERLVNLKISSTSYGIVDTAFCLSMLNRKAFRQGMEYAYEGIEVFGDLGSSVNLKMYRLPHGWVTSNAWTKAFRMWKQMQNDAKDISGTSSMEARYNDFKVYFNEAHWSYDFSGIAGELLKPLEAITKAEAQNVDASCVQDWEYSRFVVPQDGGSATTLEFNGGMIGDDASGTPGYRGMIKAYAESRRRPFPVDPNVVTSASYPDGGLYSAMSDVGSTMTDVMDNVVEFNNSPPYVLASQNSLHEFYPGGSNPGSSNGILHDTFIIRSGNSAYGTDQCGPFSAYCGLLIFDNGTNDNDVYLKLKVAAGPYKGVMARPMQDVN